MLWFQFIAHVSCPKSAGFQPNSREEMHQNQVSSRKVPRWIRRCYKLYSPDHDKKFQLELNSVVLLTTNTSSLSSFRNLQKFNGKIQLFTFLFTLLLKQNQKYWNRQKNWVCSILNFNSINTDCAITELVHACLFSLTCNRVCKILLARFGSNVESDRAGNFELDWYN